MTSMILLSVLSLLTLGLFAFLAVIWKKLESGKSDTPQFLLMQQQMQTHKVDLFL